MPRVISSASEKKEGQQQLGNRKIKLRLFFWRRVPPKPRYTHREREPNTNATSEMGQLCSSHKRYVLPKPPTTGNLDNEKNTGFGNMLQQHSSSNSSCEGDIKSRCPHRSS